MLRLDPAYWSDHLRNTLARYDEPLLRAVAGRLARPRGQWPAEELIDRCVATLANAAVIDRRLKELEPAGQRLLAVIGLSRQPRWRLGSLVEVSAALRLADDPLAPLLALLQAGLLFPDLEQHGARRLTDFEQWVGRPGPVVFAPPPLTDRCRGEDLGLPVCAAAEAPAGAVQEADGLEWPLRLAAFWQ